MLRMSFRSRRLEALLGARFEDLTYDDFKAIEGNPTAVESDDLDWKVKYSDDKKEANAELAKDVAAFANATGGMLVLGMAEDRATSAASRAVNHPITDRTEREIHQAIASGVFPLPRYNVRRLHDPAGDGSQGLLLIGVLPSPLAPHAILSASRPDYAFPRRRGTKIDWLNEPEIATAYRRRFAESASREKRLDDIEFDNLEVFFETGQREPILTISLVPEIPGDFTIDRTSYAEVQEAVLGFGTIGPNLQRTLREITVGSARLQATDAHTSPRIHCDFHADGSGVWGVVPRVHAFNDDEDEAVGCAQTHNIVTHILNALVVLSRHATERAGVTGTALVRVSLWSSVYDHQSFTAHIGLSLEGKPYDFDTLHLGRFENSQQVAVESSRTVQQAHGDSVVVLESITQENMNLTQTAAYVASTLLQAFGIIETGQFREDGTVRSYAFGRGDEQYWLDWSTAHGIPFVRTGR